MFHDTIICRGRIIKLDAKNNLYTGYHWNTGDSTSFIMVTLPFRYVVHASNGICSISDSSNVGEIFLPRPSFNDTTICLGDKVKLDAFNNAYKHYFWSTGDTNSYLMVSDSGKYHLYAWDGDCSVSDSVYVKTESFPLALPSDTSICEGSPVKLDALNSHYGHYAWSTGDSVSLILASTPGIYWVRANSGQCIIYDTILVSEHVNPLSLPTDTSFCEGTSLLLNAFSTNILSYLWNSGDTSSSILITTAGVFMVKIKLGDCFFLDTSSVNLFNYPFLSLPEDTEICSDELDKFKLDAGTGIAYNWWPDAQITRIITPTHDGVLGVILTDSNGCTARDSLRITLKNCYENPDIPNVFTPDKNGFNDAFDIRVRRAETFHLIIFNRWGEKVFESHEDGMDNDGRNWNGKLMNTGDECAEGVYFYIFSWRYSVTQPEKAFTGTVTLIR